MEKPKIISDSLQILLEETVRKIRLEVTYNPADNAYMIWANGIPAYGAVSYPENGQYDRLVYDNTQRVYDAIKIVLREVL